MNLVECGGSRRQIDTRDRCIPLLTLYSTLDKTPYLLIFHSRILDLDLVRATNVTNKSEFAKFRCVFIHTCIQYLVFSVHHSKCIILLDFRYIKGEELAGGGREGREGVLLKVLARSSSFLHTLVNSKFLSLAISNSPFSICRLPFSMQYTHFGLCTRSQE